MILAGNRARAEKQSGKESGERRNRAGNRAESAETEREIVELEIKHIKNLQFVK
jgi:hypothetical protein